VLKEIGKTVDDVGRHIQDCEFKKATSGVMSLASLGNQYFNEKEPWKTDSAGTLYVSACIVRSLSILMAPFLPFSAQKLWHMLGYDGYVHEQQWNSAKEPVKSQPIKDVTPLFKILEDEDIAEQKAKLEAIK